MEIMEPLGARVVLHREVAKKIGSIYIPDEAAKRHASLRCTVIKCGPACEWGLEPGDDVLIGRLAGTWANKDGKPVTDVEEAEYFIVMEDDILVKFEEQESEVLSLADEMAKANGRFKKEHESV